QVQTSNKFAALEEEENGDEQGKQLAMALVAVQSSPKSPAGGNHGTVQHHQQQIFNTARKLNPAAPEFNLNSAGIGSTNGGADSNTRGGGQEEIRGKESTAQWVQRAFNGNAGGITVGVNTSCQDIPSQDTLVDKELASNPEIQTNDTVFPKVNEKVQWSGGKLWSNLREEDSDADEVPLGAQADEEPMHEEKEDEKQSVNGNAIITFDNKADDNSTKANTESKEQAVIKNIQDKAGSHGECVQNAEGIGIDAVDPGGTGE
ncbi:hypothetical protein A4A49_60368, partial [Nicotiana attenuata]